MNVRYLHGDEEIWAPAEHTDAVFRSLIELFARRLSVRSGIDWDSDGRARVDAAALAPFAQAVIDEWETVGSTAFHHVTDGFIAVLQVVAERCRLELVVSDEAYALATAMRHNM